MGDVLYRQVAVLQIKVGECSKVNLVVKTSLRHHLTKAMPLPTACHVHLYTTYDTTNVENTFDDRLERVDVSALHCILLMYHGCRTI